MLQNLYTVCTTNHLSWTGIPYPLCPTPKDADAPAQSFCKDDEHGKVIDLIVSMMKNGDGDIQPIKQPEVLNNGSTLNLIQCSYIQK